MSKVVCVIPGDDAGPEVVLPTVDILKHMGLDIEFLWPPAGGEAMKKYGDSFPPEAKEAVDAADCTLLGAVSSIKSGRHRGGIGYLRRIKKTYANFRPTKYFEGMCSPLRNPEGIDFVIARENLEGLYPGREGNLSDLEDLKTKFLVGGLIHIPIDTSLKGKFAVRIITEEYTRNIAEAACQLALRRKAEGRMGKVTVTEKSTVLIHTDGLFRQVVEETVKKYPELTFERQAIDNFGQQLVKNPQQFDVVVMANEHGDVMGDVAAGLVGGLGVAASACIGKDYAYFEPVHGSAPDIAGRNIINPTATILSAVWMLDYLGLGEAAKQLESAVRRVYAEGKHLTFDMGGTASTTEFADAVKGKL